MPCVFFLFHFMPADLFKCHTAGLQTTPNDKRPNTHIIHLQRRCNVPSMHCAQVTERFAASGGLNQTLIFTFSAFHRRKRDNLTLHYYPNPKQEALRHLCAPTLTNSAIIKSLLCAFFLFCTLAKAERAASLCVESWRRCRGFY